MIDRKLNDYVKKYINSGYDRNQIRHTLMNSGWSRSQVDEAIGHALSKHPAPYPHDQDQEEQAPPPLTPMGILRRFRQVLFHPKGFFVSVASEKDYERPVKFYLLITLVEVIMMNLLALASFSLNPQDFDPGLGYGLLIALALSDLIFANVMVILAIGLTFVSAGYLHLFISLFGGKGGYQSTYKLTVYSSAPAVFFLLSLPLALASPFITFAVALVSGLWAFVIQITGISVFHRMTGARIALMVLAVASVTIAAAFFAVPFLLPLIMESLPAAP